MTKIEYYQTIRTVLKNRLKDTIRVNSLTMDFTYTNGICTYKVFSYINRPIQENIMPNINDLIDLATEQGILLTVNFSKNEIIYEITSPKEKSQIDLDKRILSKILSEVVKQIFTHATTLKGELKGVFNTTKYLTLADNDLGKMDLFHTSINHYIKNLNCNLKTEQLDHNKFSLTII